MTYKEAADILDPKTTREALRPYNYDSKRQIQIVEDACELAANVLRSAADINVGSKWIKVKDRPPELSNNDWCSVIVNTFTKGNTQSQPMIYERAIIRGKRVERWKYYWDRLADEAPDYWMPLPEIPEKD